MNVGKRIGKRRYLSRQALMAMPEEGALVERAARLAGWDGWTVAAIEEGTVRLLDYGDLGAEAFPTLKASQKVELRRGKVGERRTYRPGRRPVLHRKELLVQDPPESWAKLTRQAEQAGLFNDPSRIGSERVWGEALAKAGLKVSGQKLVAANCPSPPACALKADAGRTAIARDKMSRPLRLALEAGLLPAGASVHDFGQGRGADVKALRAKGYDVTGHDPVYAPGKPRKADVVLLVYILNVLTSPCEREHVFKQAWKHARKRLIVAVRVDKQAPGKPCGDGVMTRSGTFQHHFTHEELLALCRKLAPRAKVQKLDPGVVAVSR